MRTSLTEIQQIDKHVLSTAATDEALLFEAKLIIDPSLKHKVALHRQTLNMVQQYGRTNLRGIIASVHQQLFTLPQHQSFRQKVLRLFNR